MPRNLYIQYKKLEKTIQQLIYGCIELSSCLREFPGFDIRLFSV